MKWLLRLLPIGVFVVLAFFLWRGLSGHPSTLPSARLGQMVPDFNLPRLTAKSGQYFSSKDMQGHIALLNIWASWCDACTEEQVFLLKLARQGIPIYGLNYHDEPDAALQWLHTWGNPYLSIGSDMAGQVAMNLGVYGTPETFLMDKRGVIQYRYAGVLTASIWQREFLPRIAKLEAKG